MRKIKKGEIVTRKSHNNDILFEVKQIINLKDKRKIAILKGITYRIEVDAYIDDLELVDKRVIKLDSKKLDKEIENRTDINILNSKRKRQIIYTGKILHLDGDRKYSEKSIKYYRNMGLNAIVKNIPEYKQPKMVFNLLKMYNPDILVITGHDGMIKKGTKFNDIYNYRNSRHFILTVREARRYDKMYNKNLVIFAGACQSYFEALIAEGANFASSPARILIDFLDPLVIAKTIAQTDCSKFVTINDVEAELRDRKRRRGRNSGQTVNKM